MGGRRGGGIDGHVVPYLKITKGNKIREKGWLTDNNLYGLGCECGGITGTNFSDEPFNGCPYRAIYT
jgi:hypothetical protein